MFYSKKTTSETSRNGTAYKRDIASLLIIFVLFGFAQASNEYRVLFLQEQGLTATECGWVLASASLLSAISRPLAGALADKLRSRRVVCIGALLSWIAVLALMLFTQNIRIANFILCAGIVPLLSISEPVTYGMIEASGVHATVMLPKLDYSMVRVCLSIGYSVINFLYTPIINRFGTAAPFYCTMVFSLGMLLFSGTMRHFETSNEENSGQSASKNKLEFRRLFSNYFLIVFVLLSFLNALGGFTSNFLIYLLNEVGLDGSLVGIASGIRVLGEIITMPLIPFLKKKISLPMLQAIACGFVILQVILYLAWHNPYAILCVTLLNGISCGITLSTTAVYLRQMAPEGLDTTTLALSSTMNCLGAFITNLVGGIVVDSFGIFTFYRLSLICLLLWIFLYFGTWIFGTKVLKKTPPVPMFIPKTN